MELQCILGMGCKGGTVTWVETKKTLTSGEGLSLARWGGWHVVHSSGTIGGAHCGLTHTWSVGLHHQIPLLIGTDAHSIAYTQPMHLRAAQQT